MEGEREERKGGKKEGKKMGNFISFVEMFLVPIF
jgi:hypothetical protein